MCRDKQSSDRPFLVTCTDAERAVLDARLGLLAAFALFLARSPDGITAAREHFCRQYNERTLWLRGHGLRASIYEMIPGVSARTLRRWAKKRTEEGPESLCPRWGGRSKRIYTSHWDHHPEQADCIEALFLKHGMRLTARQIHFELAGRFPADTLPGLRTIGRFKRRFQEDQPQVADYLTDPDAWKGRHLVALGRRDEDVERLSQVWEIDGTKADILLQHAGTNGTMTLRRYAVLGVVEVYSRMAHILAVPTESAYGALLLLRRAILEWRRFPERVRIDQGSPYRSRYFQATLRRLEIQIDPLLPGHPEEKPYVERFFRTFNTELLPLLPGFTGKDLVERQAVRARRRRSQPEQVLELTFDEFQDFCDGYARYYNSERIHSGIGTTPADRVARWNERELPVRGIPEADLADYRAALGQLLPPAPRRGRAGEGVRVIRKGKLRLNGLTYWAAEFGAEWNGRSVLVRHDPTELGFAAVYDLEGQFLCEARAVGGPFGVSPQETAREARRVQRAFMTQAVAELKRNARSLDLSSVARQLATRKSSGLSDNNLPVNGEQGARHLPAAIAGALEAARAATGRMAEPDGPGSDEPATGRPALWESDWHRYAWCRGAAERGAEKLLTSEDRAFLTWFEERILQLK